MAGRKTLQFAKKGYKVIVACRHLEISQLVYEKVKKASHHGTVVLMQVDMSFDFIRTFYDEYKNKFDEVDLLIQNAACFNHGEKYRKGPGKLLTIN